MAWMSVVFPRAFLLCLSDAPGAISAKTTLKPGPKETGWKELKFDEILRSTLGHLHELLTFEANNP
jgi:hypothetical protein